MSGNALDRRIAITPPVSFRASPILPALRMDDSRRAVSDEIAATSRPLTLNAKGIAAAEQRYGIRVCECDASVGSDQNDSGIGSAQSLKREALRLRRLTEALQLADLKCTLKMGKKSRTCILSSSW